MPNWTEQILHVVGTKTDVDRFIRAGYSRRSRDQFDNLLLFTRLCPLKRGEKKTTYTHDSGVVLTHFRTRTQALFGIITSWDYPAEFYPRLARHWPTLSFICSVNDEMGAFGGILMVREGRCVNLVKDYEGIYNRRAHAREIRAMLKEWNAFLTADRPVAVVPHAAWEHRSMPFDAHFNDDFMFFFRTADDLARFRRRYRTSPALKREGNSWVRARAIRAE
jgi:hypothetical protein